MKEFLKQKKDVNGRDLKGVTALGYAVGHDQISAVKLLIDAKANTDDVDSAGSSAAQSKANQVGLTPLAVATQNLAVAQQKQNMGNHAAVVGILQRAGAGSNLSDLRVGSLIFLNLFNPNRS